MYNRRTREEKIVALLEEMIQEAIESDFRCSSCSAVNCNCDSEAGEPNEF